MLLGVAQLVTLSMRWLVVPAAQRARPPFHGNRSGKNDTPPSTTAL